MSCATVWTKNNKNFLIFYIDYDRTLTERVCQMSKPDFLTMAMMVYDAGDAGRIQHFIKVHALSV